MRIARRSLTHATCRIKPARFAIDAVQPVPVISIPLGPEDTDSSSGPVNGNGHGIPELTSPEARPARSLEIVILGLSITSSWGNGHATTYRALARELRARGHHVLFLERNTEWYAANRDLPRPPYAKVALYDTLAELRERYSRAIGQADAVIVGSYVQEGAAIGDWVTGTAEGVTAFYDIDTPVTMANLAQQDLDYLSRSLIPKYQLYLSFTGGPLLKRIEQEFGSPMARPLYCSVDTTLYYPEERAEQWHLGYMGTYSEDRQPGLDELLLEPARNWAGGRFVVAGPQYPKSIRWPKNVRRFTHLSPQRHRGFYNAQRFTLNITRGDMIEAGYSPSVRLFEAAACGTPIISDYWEGLDSFFKPNEEILISDSCEETLYYLLETSEAERQKIGERARRRVLAQHTAKHRAQELESYFLDVLSPATASSGGKYA